ncbi:MAG: RIP metalloprotease RseP, partial [Rhizobiales bacterium]|nr:RIP metalloprotease RseP [Hyphomicrobiales bacterium]
GWYDRHGTRWKISWIPLGGYVKFLGDANPASLPGAAPAAGGPREPGDFHGKPVWQRAAVVAAGPVANFLLAIAIFTAAFAIVGVPVSEPRVDRVQAGSAAEKAGLKPGDLILSVDGRAIEYFSDLQEAIVTRAGEPMSVVIERGSERLTLAITPELREEPDGFGGKIRIGRLGVEHDPQGDVTYQRYSPGKALQKGVERTWFIVSMTFDYLGKLVTGNEKADQLGGPIAMAKAAGDAASVGIFQFISVIAFLSVSIGLINLFPIPMLDGGHLVYYGIEALRGKPLGPNAQEWGFRIGFSLVIMLMVVGTWNDVIRLIAMAIGG